MAEMEVVRAVRVTAVRSSATARIGLTIDDVACGPHGGTRDDTATDHGPRDGTRASTQKGLFRDRVTTGRKPEKGNCGNEMRNLRLFFLKLSNLLHGPVTPCVSA